MPRVHDRSPDAVRNARAAAKLTQAQAAEDIHVTERAWQHYESGFRTIPIASWELFLLKTGQHPNHKLR